ncbi:MAG TPA: Stk1 family PASTA domain-containing Ser/Thr kinase, partial [Acidimicrobiales bacterium]|nr:Stk1 family PASTA domain-containing Ser/Thr kinase [Acidimicrobiales bacterium]
MPSPEVFSERYELVRHIARGGMAQVYLAQDLLLDRPVAIKVLFPELSSDPSFVERFRREAQAAANLSHANIVSIYDWGQGEHTYFIVMEYIDGQTLSALIRQGSLAPTRAAAIGADMAGALDFAHRRGVIHRDVKPGNVLIDRAGQVKVADFGIARAVSQASEGLTQTGAVMGTATYFSPEQAQGLPVDARSDVYSMGVVLYEMVTGKPPFSGDSPVAIAYKHVREQPSLPSAVNASVPADFEAIVMAAMAKDPEDRYQSAADLRDDLLRFQRGEAVYAPRAGAGASPTRVVPSRTGQVAAYGDTQVLGRTSVIEAVSAYEQDQPRSHAGLWAALFAFLLAVLGVLIYFIGDNASWWGNHTVSTIPALKGEQVAGAEALLKADGIRWQVAHTPSLQVPSGQVSGTVPGAGSRVPPNHTVTLNISTGAPYAAVPDVTKMSCAQADMTLSNKNFHPRNTSQTSATVGPRIVISTSPPPGARRQELTTVVVHCSAGQAQTRVPVVSGMSQVQAAYKLAQAHLTPAPNVTKVWSSTIKPGYVVYTQPPNGSPEPYGKSVELFVSGG